MTKFKIPYSKLTDDEKKDYFKNLRQLFSKEAKKDEKRLETDKKIPAPDGSPLR